MLSESPRASGFVQGPTICQLSFYFFFESVQFSSFFFFGCFVFVFVNLYYLLDNPNQAFIDRANLSGNQRASILSVLVLFFLLTL